MKTVKTVQLRYKSSKALKSDQHIIEWPQILSCETFDFADEAEETEESPKEKRE